MLVEEFAGWLRRWFSEDEVKAMVGESWRIEDGVKLRGSCIMNIEEFLQLAATFAVERALGGSGREVKILAKYNEVCAIHVGTRTVLIASAYRGAAVSTSALNEFLQEIVEQAEEGRDFYMSVRSVVC
ncbi:MAG: hypothetical protein QXE23_08960 [Nitrososphaerota archaeon]